MKQSKAERSKAWHEARAKELALRAKHAREYDPTKHRAPPALLVQKFKL